MARILSIVSSAGQRARQAVPLFRSRPDSVRYLLYAGCFLALLFTAVDILTTWQEDLRWMGQDIEGDGKIDVTGVDVFYSLFLRTMLRALFFLLPAFLAWCIARHPKHPYPILPATLVSIFLLLLFVPMELYHGIPRATSSSIGEQPYLHVYLLKVFLLSVFLISPPLLVWLYSLGTLLDRYVVRSFLMPFLLSFLAFLSIWFISDMANKGGEFVQADIKLHEILQLYAMQVPNIVVLILPITLLLSVLFCLGKMSRANELVTMLMAGISTLRILRPLLIIGLVATFFSLICNYEWGPLAQGNVKAAMESFDKGEERRYSARDQVFIDRVNNRIWYVGRFPQVYIRDNKIENVLIAQFNDDNELVKTIQADQAFWQDHDGLWVFWQGQITTFDDNGLVELVSIFPQKHLVRGWPETPWKIISMGLDPENLGIPQITAYMQAYHDSPSESLAPFRTHWHHRFALPFNCMVSILIGAPLGMVFSRRSVLGGVAASILLFFSTLFLTNLFLALGQGAHLHPFAAAWATNAIFGGIGATLLYYRARNREIPSPATFWKNLTIRDNRQPAHATG